MKIAMLVPDDRDEHRRYDVAAPYFGSAPTALLEGLAELSDCEIHIVCCAHRAMQSPIQLARNIYYHSLIVPAWGWSKGGYWGCIRAIKRKLPEINPDIVHGQGTERYCALAAIFSGFPNVLTIHGNMRMVAKVDQARPFSFQWLAARLEEFTLPRTGGVVCISAYTQRNCQTLAPKTWLVSNAVEGSFFSIANTPSKPRQILCVGQICQRKNQTHLIRALDSLATQPKFELVFYGGALRDDPYVQQFFSLLETRPWCRFAGFADRPRLQTALSSATLLVLPSLEDNCPMVVLEAMAASVPVAGARVGGVPDLINDGVDGVLFDPERVDELRAALIGVLQDDEKARNMAAMAKEKALRCFHPKKIAQRHLEIYHEAIGQTASVNPL